MRSVCSFSSSIAARFTWPSRSMSARTSAMRVSHGADARRRPPGWPAPRRARSASARTAPPAPRAAAAIPAPRGAHASMASRASATRRSAASRRCVERAQLALGVLELRGAPSPARPRPPAGARAASCRRPAAPAPARRRRPASARACCLALLQLRALLEHARAARPPSSSRVERRLSSRISSSRSASCAACARVARRGGSARAAARARSSSSRPARIEPLAAAVSAASCVARALRQALAARARAPRSTSAASRSRRCAAQRRLLQARAQRLELRAQLGVLAVRGLDLRLRLVARALGLRRLRAQVARSPARRRCTLAVARRCAACAQRLQPLLALQHAGMRHRCRGSRAASPGPPTRPPA